MNLAVMIYWYKLGGDFTRSEQLISDFKVSLFRSRLTAVLGYKGVAFHP